jgi:hypothetical protein
LNPFLVRQVSGRLKWLTWHSPVEVGALVALDYTSVQAEIIAIDSRSQFALRKFVTCFS